MLSATSRSLFGLLLAAVLITVGAAPMSADNAVLVISPGVKAYLDQYLQTRRPLAFAVSADGTRAGYVYCADYNCQRQNFRNEALGLCARTGGKSCKILAVGRDVKLAYRVDPAQDMTLLPLPTIGQPKSLPCIGKSEPECKTLALEFESRRNKIESKWADKIDQWHRSLCGPNGGYGSRPCRVKMAELEQQRDAELAALDEEFRTTMAE